MSINTKFQRAVLPIETRIEPRQIRHSLQVFLRGFIFVFETAFVAFGAGSSQITVIAQFVAGGATLDLVENCRVDGDGPLLDRSLRLRSRSWPGIHNRLAHRWKRAGELKRMLLDLSTLWYSVRICISRLQDQAKRKETNKCFPALAQS
jgi:hypothetical protein